MIKSNTTDSLKIQKNMQENRQENRSTSYREYQQKTTGINWDKDGIVQKGFLDNSENLRNATGTYSQILQMEKIWENIFK